MKQAQPVNRPLVAVPAQWNGQEGYLHVSEEYSFAAFKRGLGSVREVTPHYVLPRLLELLPRCPILHEADLLCTACRDWHPVAKDCAARPAKQGSKPIAVRSPRPAPPRRVLEIDAGPTAALPGSLQGADPRPLTTPNPAPGADFAVRYKDDSSTDPPHLHLVPPAEPEPPADGALDDAAVGPSTRRALAATAVRRFLDGYGMQESDPLTAAEIAQGLAEVGDQFLAREVRQALKDLGARRWRLRPTAVSCRRCGEEGHNSRVCIKPARKERICLKCSRVATRAGLCAEHWRKRQERVNARNAASRTVKTANPTHDRALALFRDGKTIAEVSRETGTNPMTLRYWCKRAAIIPAKKTTLIDLTGQSFGKLTVERLESTDPKQGARWFCRCACGGSTVAFGKYLRAGDITSCGCNKSGNKRHPYYEAWHKMPRSGIVERWRDFRTFVADVAERPTPEHVLTRIDKSKPYGPGNVAWRTRQEVARARKSSHLIEHNGETRSLAEWAEVAGLPYHVITHRLEAGWSMERALATPKGKSKPRAPKVASPPPLAPRSGAPFLVRPDGSIECATAADALALAKLIREGRGR